MESFFAGFAGKGFLQFVFRLIELDSRISSQFTEFAEGFAVATGTNDSARAQQPGDLHRELAGDPGCAENQHGLALGQLCVLR